MDVRRRLGGKLRRRRRRSCLLKSIFWILVLVGLLILLRGDVKSIVQGMLRTLHQIVAAN